MYRLLTWKRMLALSMSSKEGNLHELSSTYAITDNIIQTIVQLW